MNDRMGLADGFDDAVYVDVVIRLDWLARIKALFGATIRLIAKVDTEHRPGKTQASSTEVLVNVPWWPQRKVGGMAEEPKK